MMVSTYGVSPPTHPRQSARTPVPSRQGFFGEGRRRYLGHVDDERRIRLCAGTPTAPRALCVVRRRAAERVRAARGRARRQLRADARLGACEPSGGSRLVFAVEADVEEDQEAGDGADDEAHGAAEADRGSADPDEQEEEERPEERRDPGREGGEAEVEVHRARS